VSAFVVIVTNNRSIHASYGRIAAVNGAIVIIVAVYFLVGTSCFAVAVIDGTQIIIVAINRRFSATSFCVTSISIALIGLSTLNRSVYTSFIVTTSIRCADVVIVTINRSGRTTNFIVARIGVAFTVSVATVRVVCVDTPLIGFTSAVLARVGIVASNVRKENTSNRGTAEIGGACIVIVTNDIFVLATFLGIASVNGTIVVIVAVDFLLNASHHVNTTNGMASIGFGTNEGGVSTTGRYIARVNSTRISIVTINVSVGTSGLGIASVVGTSVLIFAVDGL